jgi:putative hydrolase of the HAD superfamily
MNVAQMVEQKEAVLFDLFHTLTAMESSWGQGLPFTFQVLGVSRDAWDRQLTQCSRERLTGALSDPIHIVSSMARAIDPGIPDAVIEAAVANRVKRFGAALLDIPAETTHVLERLKRKGKRLGLISNADVMEVAEWSKSPLAGVFDSTVLSCRVGVVKPDREIYEICLRQLDVSPAKALFVGDGGSSELAGAHTVGLVTVMITGIIKELWPERIESRRADADYVIERLPELLNGDDHDASEKEEPCLRHGAFRPAGDPRAPQDRQGQEESSLPSEMRML